MNPATAPSIRLDGIVKHFPGIVALDGISANIFPGRLTGLVGPDGAGCARWRWRPAGLNGDHVLIAVARSPRASARPSSGSKVTMIDTASSEPGNA